MSMAPYQVTNIIFDKDERFRFGSKKQHPVNNMLFFEAAVRQEYKSNGLSLEENNKPHKWEYDKMIEGSKAAQIRRKMPRGMTARQDPVITDKLKQLKAVVEQESYRRSLLVPHYDDFLKLFDGVKVGSVHDEYPPIPLSSQAQARRDAIERRRKAREERPRMTTSPKTSKEIIRRAASRLRGPKMTAIQAKIIRAKLKGQKITAPGIMSQTASRGLT